ncbi:MAG TPA: cytochrome c maturation protein CcmE [Aliidongia sp.]|nr:cytochrome c maturation protein CcmE [Aliidongia sp.]
MTRKRRRLIMVVGGMACLSVAAFLVLNAFNDNLVFFYSPSEIAQKQPAAGRMMRIGGLVEEQSVTKSEGGKRIAFKVTDGAHDLPVVYVGVPPSLFREGQGVVAEGRLDRDGVFQAQTIMAKHDERYMPPEVAAALKKSGQWRGEEAASAPATPALGNQASR